MNTHILQYVEKKLRLYEKKNVLVCGKGRWGKKVILILKKISNIVRILDSKTDHKTINLSKIDWVFILTPIESHFKLVNYFLTKKKIYFVKSHCVYHLNKRHS